MKKKYRHAFKIAADYPVAGLNQWARMSKFERHNHDAKVKLYFSLLLRPYAGIFFFKEFEIELRANTLHDIDNTIIIIKIFVDVIRRLGLAQNDNRKFYKGCRLLVDNSLERKKYIISVNGIFKKKSERK
jgi:hypothetical protein